MANRQLEQTLERLEELIREERFESLETDTIEIKPVPPTGKDWGERKKTVNAFLNSRGGVLILGIAEDRNPRRYVLKGWRESEEQNVRLFSTSFKDARGHELDLNDRFPPPMFRQMLDKQIALVFVDELPDDRKFVFYDGNAYKRHFTGDVIITQAEIDAQEEYREEAITARELTPVGELSIDDIDLDKLNEYIHFLNRTVKIETIKPDLASAESFLTRKKFLIDGRLTTLGALVCAKHPGDTLGFRCQVHGYVDAPNLIARDKQDYSDNVLPLMEKSLAYLLRNIQVGVSSASGGRSEPQYPEELLRETMNNALAHRDYSINKQIIVQIKPGTHVSISNPGRFRDHFLLEAPSDPIPVLRIIPEARARNPRLADVLRVFNKWEGKGIGMATLVNLCLDNRIDLPYYRLKLEDVSLVIPSGKLLDDRMERFFASFDGFLEDKLQGKKPTLSQLSVLSYLLKSEWANREERHTILFTSDNNHSHEIRALEDAGLVHRHPKGSIRFPVFVADRELAVTDYLGRLRNMFGVLFDSLDEFQKRILGVVWRFEHYSKRKDVSAKQAAWILWHESRNAQNDIAAFDAFYRRTRRGFNGLEKNRFLEKAVDLGEPTTRTKGYRLNRDFKPSHLS